MSSCLVENGGWILHGGAGLLDLRQLRWVGLPRGPDTALWELAGGILALKSAWNRTEMEPGLHGSLAEDDEEGG